MAHRTPEELRQDVRSLLQFASEMDEGDAKRRLALRAFVLAQEAEAAERSPRARPAMGTPG